MFYRSNRVLVKPIKDDLRALTDILDSSPFEMVRDEDLSSTIIYTSEPIYDYKPDNRLHHATITGLVVDYDPYYKVNSLWITLDAPSFLERRQEIIDQYNVQPMQFDYRPHITLVYNLPPVNRRKYRWWVNLAEENFNNKYKGSVIRFRNEQIASTDDTAFGSSLS